MEYNTKEKENDRITQFSYRATTIYTVDLGCKGAQDNTEDSKPYTGY